VATGFCLTAREKPAHLSPLAFLIHVQTEIRGFYLTKYKAGEEKEKEKQRDFKIVFQFFNQFEIVSFPWQSCLNKSN